LDSCRVNRIYSIAWYGSGFPW